MNASLAVAALILLFSLMLMLPLVPAFVELRRKSDASPLNVVQQHAGEIRHFANSFRTYIQVLGPTLKQCVALGFDGKWHHARRSRIPGTGPMRRFADASNPATGRNLFRDDCGRF